MPEFVDPYIDPETGILRNLVDAKTTEELRKAEGDIIFAAEMEWVGKLRTVNISRGDEEIFLDYPYLTNGTKYFFDELAKENHLQNCDRI